MPPNSNQMMPVPGPDPSMSHTIAAAGWEVAMPEEDEFLSPRVLLRAFSQWWHIAIPCAVVLSAISATLVMLSFVPQYQAAAVLKIASYTPYIAYDVNEHASDPKEFTETQIELLKSSMVMEQVVAREDIAVLSEVAKQDSPVKWLLSRLSVSQVGNSELYRIKFDGPNPENAAVLVNAVLDGYFAVRSRDQEENTDRVLKLLEIEKQSRGDRISELREKMRELGKSLTGIDMDTGKPTEESIGLGQLEKLNEMVVTAEFERKMLEMEIASRTETLERTETHVQEAHVEMAISESQEMTDLRGLIADKKAMLLQIESAAAAGQNDPTYRRLERELKSFERKLDDVASLSRPMVKSQLQSMAELENKDMIGQLTTQLESKKVQQEWLQNRYEEQLAATNMSGDRLLELEFTRNELAREERVFDMIAERSMALQTESRAPGRVVLLRPAEPPAGPLETIPLRHLAAVIFFCSVLPFGLALLWELTVRRVVDASQLSSSPSLPVVAEVVKLPSRLRTLVPGGRKAMSLFEESIDSLRVGLILPDQFQDLKVVTVTSAVHSEGKSSISSQLAVSLGASCRGPVLVIDGDLRNPAIHRIFDVPNKIGLATVLEGAASLDEAINESWGPVHVLPAGQLQRNPHQLIAIETLNKLLEPLRSRYRYIIIDTPPVLSAAESLLFGKVADGAILSTRRNFSRESQVRLAHDRLRKAGARTLGAVFNGVPSRSYKNTYGNYECVKPTWRMSAV